VAFFCKYTTMCLALARLADRQHMFVCSLQSGTEADA